MSPSRRGAFQLDAVLLAAGTALRCGDDAAVDRVRRVPETLLAPPGAGQTNTRTGMPNRSPADQIFRILEQ